VTSSPSTPTPSSRGCCENGRPVLTDPATGQSLCSCQYSSALLGYSRLPGLTPSLFSPGTYPPGTTPSGYGAVSLGSEGSAFYPPLGANGSNLRDSTDAWRSLTQSSLYDTSAMGFYPYGGYGGLDLNARRKNATRESTNTLKAWLHEHIKNPYPTKGEKIMLAIITKMTLTQVSTWFANARRRLKKENKMTCPLDRKAPLETQELRFGSLSAVTVTDGKCSDADVDVTSNHTSSDHTGNHNKIVSKSQGNAAESDCVSPVPSIGEDSRSRLSPPQSRDSDSSFNLEGHVPSDFDSDQQKPKIWSVTDFLHPGSKNSAGHETSSCKESGMKMDVMRCVPTSSESAVDLTGRTVATVSAAAHAQAHAAALSARGAGFLPPMTSLSHAQQQLSSYQSALASYAAHQSYNPAYAFASAEMNKLVMRPTATRFSPYANTRPTVGVDPQFPPARDFSILREGE
ncbi:hypothetical protein BaRGS_00004164, partial [Batillaria attramentaria]